MARSVFNITNGYFGLSMTDPDEPILTATIDDYVNAGVGSFGCQIISGTLEAGDNTSTKDTPGTWCEPSATEEIPGITPYSINITALQDPQIVAGLSAFLYLNDTLTAYFYMGFSGDDPPKAIGQCRLKAGTLGGERETDLQFTAVFPCKGKPVVAFGNATTHTVVGGPATGAGTPFNVTTKEGIFTPSGSEIPANLAMMSATPVIATPLTAWTVGQHVVLADSSHAHWSSTAWVAGDA